MRGHLKAEHGPGGVPRPGRVRRLGAFTLIEMLIALAILAVISGLGVISFSALRRSSEAGARSEELNREVRVFLNRLDAELAGAVFLHDDESTLFSSSLTQAGMLECSTLSFTTISPQAPYELIDRGEVVRVEYLVRETESGEHVLVKRMGLNVHAIGRLRPVDFPVFDDVEDFRLRFSKGGRWYDDWDQDSTPGLPDSVELALEAGGRQYSDRFNLYISER